MSALIFVLSWQSLAFADIVPTDTSLIGEYTTGMWMQIDTLYLSPDREFVRMHAGDVSPERTLQGTYERQGDYLILTYRGIVHLKYPSMETAIRRDLNTQDTLVVVHWGQRIYLIPDNEMMSFCRDINRGYEPRPDEKVRRHWNRTYLKNGGEKLKVHGIPILPQDWMTQIFDTPLTGQIIESHLFDTNHTFFTEHDYFIVNLGIKHGLRPGMILIAKHTMNRKEPNFDELNVTAVENDTSVVKLARLRGFRVDWHVGLGDAVSTRWDEEIERYRKRSRVKTK